MNTQNYTHTFTMPRTAQEVHDAICRVSEWWTINTEGPTHAEGEEFTVQFGEVHLTKQHITEMLSGRRIVWKVTEAHLPWLNDKEEWKGTEIVFEITPAKNGVQLDFTHIGLTPQVECYAQCEKGWDYFIGTSLFKLITEGQGMPDTTESTHMDTIGHVGTKNA
jgi:hypothetical protein